MEREAPKVKVDTVIKLCTEGIELLSQGRVEETINGFLHTLEMARQMLAVHNGRGDILVKAKVQLGEVAPGTRGKVIKNDEMGMLVQWATELGQRPLVDLFVRDQFEDYIELEGQCKDHHSH